jgi:peptidyl-dipeptidase Dcp
MQPRTLPVLLSCLALASGAFADTPRKTAMSDGPFAHPSTLPYQLPPFDRIRNADYQPAFEAGMREQNAEIERIAHNPAAADFNNTIVALERSGRMLDRVATVFSNLNSSNTNPELQKLDALLAPRLQAHQDAIFLNHALYARVENLYERRQALQLDPESLQLLERYRIEFVRAGARLSAADQTRLRDINGELSSLTTRFKQNVLQATKDNAVVVDQVAELEGLSEQQIGAAAAAAAARGMNGKWLIALQNTTTQPSLAELQNRGLRERIYNASINRGLLPPAQDASHEDTDNTKVIARIVTLRAERAALLGYASHAAYQLEDESAATPAAVHGLLTQLVAPALTKARQDAGELQKLIDAEATANHTPGFTLQPWDWAYYAEKLRQQRYEFDQNAVKPYFELDHVLHDGLFYAAHELYGLEFRERHDLPVYQQDVRVFEVFDASGAPLALFLGDYYARDNKQGGAWMNSLVHQSTLFGLKPVVCNNLNIPKPQSGQPTLLTFDEVTGIFHEFGHALHGMLSHVRYPTLSGTSVPRDFVEYPSQYNEMWAREPKVLAHYARHYQTGAPMPQALLDKVLAAQKFGQGFATTEYLAAALLDQSWHQLKPGQTPAAGEVAAFETAALRNAGIDFAPIPPRYHSTYFSHVFSGGYSAGYYAYLWSEVLARDTGQWMHEHGGLTRANGDRLRNMVLSRGRTEDPQTQFRNFYGGPPELGPLLEYRGLVAAAP